MISERWCSSVTSYQSRQNKWYLTYWSSEVLLSQRYRPVGNREVKRYCTDTSLGHSTNWGNIHRGNSSHVYAIAKPVKSRVCRVQVGHSENFGKVLVAGGCAGTSRLKNQTGMYLSENGCRQQYNTVKGPSDHHVRQISFVYFPALSKSIQYILVPGRMDSANPKPDLRIL